MRSDFIGAIILILFISGTGSVSSESGYTSPTLQILSGSSHQPVFLSAQSILVPVTKSTNNQSDLPVNLSSILFSGNNKSESSGEEITTRTDNTWPSPVILSLYPPSILAGSRSSNLTIDGNYFIPDTQVYWDASENTAQYLSPYQMTTEIPDSLLTIPGSHYIWVNNPSPYGNKSNIIQYNILDSGRTFPLAFHPSVVQNIRGRLGKAGIFVQNLSKGLKDFNITLEKDTDAPFSFYYADFPAWIASPRIRIMDANRLIITGEYVQHQTGDEPYGTGLVNISIKGNKAGLGYLHCTLNEARADDYTQYGDGYIALPVSIGELVAIINPAGGTHPLPSDPDADGMFEDVNGNTRLDFGDIILFAENIEFIARNEPIWLFDYDQNNNINYNDVINLFDRMNM